MIPVMQTVLGRGGNCFSACLASLFNLPIEDVPNFFDIAGEDDAMWWGAVRDWLRVRGFGIMSLDLTNPSFISVFEGWFIVCGKSSRGLDHATLWRNGEMMHDPHPSQCGLIKPDTVDLLYPLDPSRLTMKVRGNEPA